MAKKRYKKQDIGSFFGNMIYDRIVPQDHFLRKLAAIIPWQQFAELLVKFYMGGAMYGRPPYNPVMLLKMLVISYLYNLSARQTEQQVTENLPMKWFVGLAVDEPAPHHSTINKFNQRLIKNGGINAFEEMLTTIVHMAQEAGVEFGSIQAIDSVHTVADVNTAKEKGRGKEGKPPRDEDAAWGVKGAKRVRDDSGKLVKIKKRFHGYKAHASLNTGSELITSLTVTPGNAYDGHQLPALLKRDLEKGIPIEIVTADRGYDDGENHYFLQTKGIHSAIILNRYRTQKKDSNKEIWFELKASDAYQQGIQERYKVERKFGEGKQGHGLSRCRYLGLSRFAVQAFMTVIALNLKRMVKLLTNTNFRGRATANA